MQNMRKKWFVQEVEKKQKSFKREKKCFLSILNAIADVD
jgi:hypothetical protein